MIVDAVAGDNRRKIIAFVGGLDLCKGRYDTPQHPIFSTLLSIHKDDYHNPNFVVIAYLQHIIFFYAFPSSLRMHISSVVHMYGRLTHRTYIFLIK